MESEEGQGRETETEKRDMKRKKKQVNDAMKIRCRRGGRDGR